MIDPADRYHAPTPQLPEVIEVSEGVRLRQLQPTKEGGKGFLHFYRRRADFFKQEGNPGITNLKEAKGAIDASKQRGISLWGINFDGQKELAGLISLHDLSHGTYELGIVVDPAVQGRSLATNSVKALATEIFASGGTRIIALTDPMNYASQIVLSRTGFREVDKDPNGDLVYELLADRRS